MSSSTSRTPRPSGQCPRGARAGRQRRRRLERPVGGGLRRDRRPRARAKVGVIAAGNFSLTAALLLRAAVAAARHLDAWEVIDYAKASKPDAPSGTARELAERLDAVRPPALGVPIDEILGAPRGARSDRRRHAGALASPPELRRLDGDRLRGGGRAAVDPPRRRRDCRAVCRRDAARDPGRPAASRPDPRARPAAGLVRLRRSGRRLH